MPPIRLILLPLMTWILAACASLDTPTFSDTDGAIRGYDPVAYRTVGAPVKGHPRFALEHNGATWFFSSAGNRDLFESDPEYYAPQYGGYCAYAMSRGYVVSIDPEAWQLYEDKLYLNFSKGVRNTWRKDIPGHVAKADRNWAEKLQQAVFE